MGHETGQLDMRPLLMKRFVWDTFPHDFDVITQVQRQLGLVPDGEDGMEVEHEASDVRINRVAPLSLTLRTLSGVGASVVALYVLAQMQARLAPDEEMEIPEGFVEGFTAQNAEVIYDSTYAILCHLMDTGVIAYGAKLTKEVASDE